MIIIFKGDLIAKKNSQRILKINNTPFITSSKAYKKWELYALAELKKCKKWNGGYPVEITFYHYRKTIRKFDFSNMFEGVQDVLQKAGIIDDDSMMHVYPKILGWEKCAENPRAIIEIKKKIFD